MTGTALTPAQVAGIVGADNNNNNNYYNPVNASELNDFRIAAVVDRLGLNMQTATQNDSVESFNLCLSLARGIDFAVANQEIPSRAPDLPALLKQVCQCRNDALQQAAIMVLMISVKNACQSGWFSDKDSEELSHLANEIASNFCTSVDFNTDPTSLHPIMETIMSRFYPRMKMGHILAFLEVKRLFVAQTDNIETSTCLVNPPQVNFLLNGKGVDRRTNVFMDTGPQMPTIVTHFLKYGSNLLQAVGQFNGNYIIIVALMTEMSTIESPPIQDYVQPAAIIVDPDSEVIEGPSRISLNCPISFRRIRTPVKGVSCKHLQAIPIIYWDFNGRENGVDQDNMFALLKTYDHQCFDLDNYMDINSKRPSWRCPHCNHHCCCTDIRIDQNMVKVLKEVGENVNDVIISSDGSWKAIMESDDRAEKRQDKFPNLEQEEPEQPDSTSLSNALPDLLDLTEMDDVIDAVGTCQTEDRKVFPNNSQNQSGNKDKTVRPHMSSTAEVHRNTSSQIEDNFWSGIYLSTFASGTSSALPDAQIGGIPESTPTSTLPSPVLTDATSAALYCEAGAFHGNTILTNSMPQNEITPPTGLQLQQFQFGNSALSNEYGRSLSTPRQVSRSPIAVQALPAQSPTTVPSRLRNCTSTIMHNGPLAASQTAGFPSIGDGFNANSSNMPRQQQLSRSHAVALQVPPMASSPRHRSHYQDHSSFSGRQTGQVSGLQAVTQARGNYQVSSGLSSELQNVSQQQTLNLRMPQSMHQTAGRFQQSAQSSATLFRAQSQQGGSQGLSSQAAGSINLQHARLRAAQQATQSARAFQTSRAASSSGNATAPVGSQRGSVGGTSQPVPSSDILENLPADQDWRPTGRMRGSLSGRAYSEALSQYIIQPTQQAQAARPSNVTSNPSNASAQLQILMANRAALQAVNYPTTGLASTLSASGVLPPRSTGMH